MLAALPIKLSLSHGATGHGDNIAVIGNTDNTAWHPADDNGVDLGSSSYEFKDVYVDGVTYTDALGFGTTAMTLPTADGSANQVLKTDGSGAFSWTTISGGASNINGLSDALVEDNSIYLGIDPSSSTNTAEHNVALGKTALDAVTTGDNNVAIGSGAMTSHTTGASNVAVGYNALEDNTTGSQNIAIGRDAFKDNVSGDRNIGIGYESLGSADTESDNIAIGTSAMGSTSINGAEYNVALGNYSLDALTSGNNNIGIGHQALSAKLRETKRGYRLQGIKTNTTTHDNTAIGFEALTSNLGDANTAIGREALNLIIVEIIIQQLAVGAFWKYLEQKYCFRIWSSRYTRH